MTESSNDSKIAGYSKQPAHSYPRWMPRFWHGMDFFTWARLLVRNRFAVAPIRWTMVATVTATSILNSFSGVFEWFLFNRAVRSLKLKAPPIFVLGHWRSGTTLLHELLMLDRRHTCPSTYQCFAPHHFLWTGWFLPNILRAFLPRQRPMDDVAMGWDRPQEDEFALVNMGVPSPYLVWAFPNHGPVADEYLDLRTLSPAERESWKDKWKGFIQRVALLNNRRIVLKSPTHTARVRTILEVFPDAKFIHIVRDPLVLYPSTVRLWKTLSDVQGFQIPRDDAGWLENSVLNTFVRMYECFEQDRKLVPAGNITDVRYEDLVADPVGQMRQIYQELNLGEFNEVEPALRQHTSQTRSYKTNKYQLPADVADRVRGRWAPYFQRYGYTAHEAACAEV